ncbi:uncharacterized protein LOC122668474 [Telopea speciosissima]|uniref:uncharacterized protein LOC122668474 n=1 Tax=Telopea speciosissima TaxID=54955 RepID=UPI001CC51E78|nr:uncharacterized protein LOC122668474 [Telopea speciosissima]
MEVLSKLFSAYRDLNLFQGVKISRSAPEFSHLLFVVDVFIFCRATQDDLLTIKAILDLFFDLTGQEINLSKSGIHFSRNVPNTYLKEARVLIATQEQSEIASALNLLDAALVLYPRLESALELKARSLLYLRRYKEVADMLQEYIPSFKMVSEESSLSSDNSSQSSHQLSKERVMLLSSDHSPSDSTDKDPTFICFSVSDLKKKVMAGLSSAAFRKESVCWSDDSFSANFAASSDLSNANPPTTPTDSEYVAQLLGHIKLLCRRCTIAVAALDAELYSEAIRHFSKIIDNRCGTPQGFLAECYIHVILIRSE